MGFKQTAEATTIVMASAGALRAVRFGSGRAGLGVEDHRHEFRFDGLLLAAGRLAERERGQPVEVAVRAGAVLVEQRDRAGAEELLRQTAPGERRWAGGWAVVGLADGGAEWT